MQLYPKLSRVLSLALALALIPIAAVSAQKVTPGATCTVLNQKVVFSKKTYTCIQSEKKFVWNKGVAISQPTPIPTPSTKSDDLQNVPCATEGKSVSTTSGSYRCEKRSDTGLTLWNKSQVKPKPNPKAFPAPAKGRSCPAIGDQFKLADGYLECRYIKGSTINTTSWIKLSNSPPKIQNPTSAQDVSQCKLKGTYDGNALTGFGTNLDESGHPGRLQPRISPAIGSNEALIVPIDFPDYPGDKNIKEIIDSNRRSYLEWIKYFSSGKLSTKLDSVDYWIRMPRNAVSYNLSNYEGENENNRTQSGNIKIAQLYIDEISKVTDLTKYRSIFVIYPSGQNVLTLDLVPRMVEFQLKEGKRNMSLFALPSGYLDGSKLRKSYDANLGTPLWAFWIHEMGHDWGLYGHAPGNGWSIGIMSNQAGISQSPNAWEMFLLTWMPDELVYCDTKSTIQNAIIKLSPLEREDNQTKMVAIALDDHRLLVVEAHGTGKWFSRRPEQTQEHGQSLGYKFKDKGYYSVIAYIVDTKFTMPDVVLVNPDGGGLAEDNGVNLNLPRYSYLLKVDGGIGSNYYPLHQDSKPYVDYGAYVAIQGDSFTVEGIKIKLLSTGDYETIEISNA